MCLSGRGWTSRGYEGYEIRVEQRLIIRAASVYHPLNFTSCSRSFDLAIGVRRLFSWSC